VSSNSNRKKNGITGNKNTAEKKGFSSPKLQELAKNKTFMKFATIAVAFILIAVILVASGLVPLSQYTGFTGSNNSNSLPSSIQTGTFTQISNGNVENNNQVNIYIVSWRGCPIGAAESWVWYNYIGQYTNNTNYITAFNHYSSSHETTVVPGLLFKNTTFNIGKVQINFNIFYVYSQYLPQNLSQVFVNQEISTLNTATNFPQQAKTDFVNYQTVVPTSIQLTNGTVISEPLANHAKHLTTCILISGNNGTFFIEGSLPSIDYKYLAQQNPSYMLNQSTSVPGISSNVNYISQIVGDAA
jgi:hypothetical protein